MKGILFCAGCLASIVSIAQPPHFEWAKKLGSVSDDQGNSIAVDSAGNVITTGFFGGPADFDPGPGMYILDSGGLFISKLDASGNFIWAKNIGKETAGMAVVTDKSGNIYITGYFYNTVDFDPGDGINNLTSAGEGDIFVLKLDNDGNFVWARSMGGPSNQGGFSVAVDKSGNVYTTGILLETADFDPNAGKHILSAANSFSVDVFVSKLDAHGNFVWAKNMGGTTNTRGNSIAVDALGNVYTTGFFSRVADFDPGPGAFDLIASNFDDVFISKLDSVGNFVWAKNIGGTSDEAGFSIVLDAFDHAYITGYYSGTADFDPGPGTYHLTAFGLNDIFVLKLTTEGSFVWAKSMGGSSDDFGQCIALDPLGNVYSTGYFYTTADFDPGPGIFNLTPASAGGEYTDMFVSKLDASGNFVWAINMGGTIWDYGLSLVIDELYNVYTTGYFAGTADFDPGPGTFNVSALPMGVNDIFVHKLNQLKTVGVNGSINSNNLTAFPNPTTGLITLVFSRALNTGHLELYNSLGVLVYQQTTTRNVQSIDLTPYPKGIYFVKWMSSNNMVSIQKVIKN